MTDNHPKSKLLVLCGPPGCGKTTLIEKFLEQNSDYKFFDIFNYIQRYKDENGDLGLNGSALAHEEMYQDLKKVKENIILEIGTNRAEFHFENLKFLEPDFKINIFLCILDKDICINRTLARWEQSQGRNYPSREYLEEKFKRGFPQVQKKISEDLGLDSSFLDMSLPTDRLLVIISE
ncbi:MAG: zeta toxin family protein [Candidatus Buchananbacteria bacterium]